MVFGAREAAWPLLRQDLHLSYGAIGLLLTLPVVGAAVIEPVLGVLADAGWRRALVVGGGAAFAASLALTGLAGGVPALLLAFVLFYPASGAFVSLSQATLMDLDPARRERNMAWWTLAGSIGVVAGPLILTAALVTGHGWRAVFLALALLTLPLVALIRRTPRGVRSPTPVTVGARAALAALRTWRVLRPLMLLEAGDLMGDLLTGYVALYAVDGAGARPAQAGIAVAVFTLAGLLGDALLLPLLARVSGAAYLRASALGVLAAYPAFLLVPEFLPKLVPLAMVGLLRAGWYAIPQAGLYAEMPEASGSVLVLTNVGGLLAGCIPLVIGVVADRAGVGSALWLLLLGPVAILLLTQSAGTVAWDGNDAPPPEMP